MNIRKLCSALGVGLAFVAVLSLFVAPVVALPFHDHRKEGSSGTLWKIYAEVEGWGDTSNPYAYTTAIANYTVSGASVTYERQVTDPTITYSKVIATRNGITGSITVEAWCWISPPGFNPTTDGGWTSW